jgi:hypothetical protein
MQNRICALCALVLATLFIGIGTARADVPAITMSDYTFRAANGARFSVGYTFTLTQPVTITALGAIDFGGTSIANTAPMPVAIYYSGATPNLGVTAENGHFSGVPVTGASASVVSTDPILSINGTPYTGGTGFRYHVLDTPITLDAETYEIQANNNGTGYATNWIGQANIDGLTAPLAATWSMDQPLGADYEANVQPSFAPGIAGPNFLVAVPEPVATGLLAVTSMMLIRRR